MMIICVDDSGSRVVKSSTCRRCRQGLCPVVRSHYLPVPLWQLHRAVPARVPDGPGGGRGSREYRTSGQPWSKQRSESGVLAQTHHSTGVCYRGRQNLLLQRTQPVSFPSRSFIGVVDGCQGGHVPPKIRGKNHVKLENFANFSRKYHKNSGILIFFSGKNHLKFG